VSYSFSAWESPTWLLLRGAAEPEVVLVVVGLARVVVGPVLEVAGPALEVVGPARVVAGLARVVAGPALEVVGPARVVAGLAWVVAGPVLEVAGPVLAGAERVGAALEVAALVELVVVRVPVEWRLVVAEPGAGVLEFGTAVKQVTWAGHGP
jgi:hypothetical protein